MTDDDARAAAPAVQLSVLGDWEIAAETASGRTATFTLSPPEVHAVERERYDRLPPFADEEPPWRQGERLLQCRAFDTAGRRCLVPGSVQVSDAPGGGAVFEPGRDYRLSEDWSQLGRLPGGRIREDQPVWISYRFQRMRLDSLVATAEGALALRHGEEHISVPHPPPLAVGETRLANVWMTGRARAIDDDHLFPITETVYPEPPGPSRDAARRMLPRTWQRLESGEGVHVLAWGDSVTHAGYLGDAETVAAQRWQAQFVARLRGRFPGAAIRLSTAGWGGHNSRNFLEAPEDSPYHYPSAVLAPAPDLVVSEFVNDANLVADYRALEAHYDRFKHDFDGIGAEWIILTPHYVSPERMGLASEKRVDEDPRGYVKGMRRYAAERGIALADASLRWGRLWRQGLPYSTLLVNTINHPDARGLKLFTDSLMTLFP
jgi:hypothetical protein